MDKYYGEGQQVHQFSEALPFIRQVVSDLSNEASNQHEPIWRRNAQIVTTGDNRLWLFSVTPGGSENISTTLGQYVEYVSSNLQEKRFHHSEVIDEQPGSITRFYITTTWTPYVKPEDKKTEYKEPSWWSKYVNGVILNTSGW
ncbi:hypothetical protein [Pseudomonas synxantha]|uniref:hypothetical protein n=1 Tax=Pseudomonas synxantha TaxID=47883 RepID=UPI000F57B484|nr:hypothetical protein [Pseudomonas synxantha]